MPLDREEERVVERGFGRFDHAVGRARHDGKAFARGAYRLMVHGVCREGRAADQRREPAARVDGDVVAGRVFGAVEAEVGRLTVLERITLAELFA